MNWYPERLYVVNVRGRALISDSYLMAEWRRDPWTGFNLAEGAWRKVRRHEYEPGQMIEWGIGEKREYPISYAMARKSILGALERMQPIPECRVERRPDLDRPAGSKWEFSDWYKRGVVAFGTTGHDPVFVNPELLDPLVHIIDGEPAEWRCCCQTSPLHAFDERGRWLGALMPVRMPKRATKEAA